MAISNHFDGQAGVESLQLRVNILEKEQERGDYKRGERKCSLDEEKSPG